MIDYLIAGECGGCGHVAAIAGRYCGCDRNSGRSGVDAGRAAVVDVALVV